MSTLAPTQSTAPAVDPAWVPSPLYRMTLEQYEAMIAAGVFTKRDRVLLINGYLVTRITESPLHGAVCGAVHASLEPLLPPGWYLRQGKPLRVPAFSIPEPDISVVRGSYRDYSIRHPGPADVALVVEVADSSLDEDRAMAGISGAGGVPVYWIVNLVHRQIEVYSGPGPGGYSSRQVDHPGDVVPVAIGGQQRRPIAVDDILP
jgi:Uma2 family endonuclease